MTTTYKEFPDTKTIEIVVDGKVTRAEFDNILPQIEAFIIAHSKVNILEIIKDFDGFESGMIWDGMKFDFKHMKDYGRCAVVSDSGWIGFFTRAFAPFFDVDIKTFSLEEEPDARLWVEEG